MNINNRIIINENMTMNQIIHITVFCLAVCLLSACGEKKITVKGADGTEYESYQECCAAQDFQAAHQFLAKMKNAIIEKESSSEKYQAEKMFNEAKEEVFKQEALFLMSQNNEEAQSRILYLLKEEGDNTDHIDMLVDLAIENDDEDFVKALTKQYKGSISSDILRKIVEFLYIEKGDRNLDFVQTMLNRYNKSELLLDAAVEKGNEDLVVSLKQQVLEEELKSLLEKSDFKVITKGIHMDDISVDGPECNEKISRFNQECIKVLRKAINYKQMKMANRAISLMKPNIVTHRGNSGNPKVEGVTVGYGKYYAQYVNSEINEAKNILNQAVHSGAFK